uniref:Uncharacterized protein n=1 Tax=Arundo donax TaxID=35708 RepID=A0A0A8ZG41_ARUDO
MINVPTAATARTKCTFPPVENSAHVCLTRVETYMCGMWMQMDIIRINRQLEYLGEYHGRWCGSEVCCSNCYSKMSLDKCYSVINHCLRLYQPLLKVLCSIFWYCSN